MFSRFMINRQFTHRFIVWQPGGWIDRKHNKNKNYIIT